MRMESFSIALLFLLSSLMNCGDDGKVLSIVRTVDNGLVHGIVTDRETGVRLAGIEVSLFIDGSWRRTRTTRDNAQTTTNEAGAYVFSKVPVGVLLRIEFAGVSLIKDEKGRINEGDSYPAFHRYFTIDPVLNGRDGNDSATELLLINHPLVQVDASLVQATATLNGIVYGEKNGGGKTTVSGATIVLTMSDYEMIRRETSGEDGTFRFSELPRDRITTTTGSLYIPPVDQDGDGHFDFQTFILDPTMEIDLRYGGRYGKDDGDRLVIDLRLDGEIPSD